MKIKLLGSLLLASCFVSPASAQLLISGVYDGNSSVPKGIEVHVVTTQDYTGWEVEGQTNAATTWSNIYEFSGTLDAGDYLYLTSTSTTLTTWGWGIGGANEKGVIINDGSFVYNGDDRMRIVNASDEAVDLFGVDGQDGTGQDWEYTDSYAYRNNNISATTTFDSSNWSFGAPHFLESVSEGQQDFLTNTFGSFTVPEPDTYALLAGISALGSVMLRRRYAFRSKSPVIKP